ncbi:transcription factor PIF6 isoform X5 [Brassica napus]|uniref:transcription factor PIF6 isoform X5 n=1 Tax=Brassica oleracea var. oleracea TaxID=109376 RepID=UPI0006A70F1E|nr:PREDICTED: transcription factor PIF6 isoform X5 [Brassica oleracea var. oleracea]XP_013615367.1 PREDICTED: transcription factor PIF6-like isoform X5 [Brassica oleracea var. oleracea]XP_013712405.1 transcription factor PIF6 isoform X5 [Brassica napus]
MQMMFVLTKLIYCCCRLTDQEYMELVFENGQILAKSQRSNGFSMHNQRTKSIVDLYEAEYNEDFKKTIHGADTSDKNLVDTQVVPEPLVVAAYETNMLMNQLNLIQSLKASSSKRMVVDYENRKDIVPPDEQSVVAERSVELGYDSTDFTEDSEESTYQSSRLDDVRPQVPARTSNVLVKRRRKQKQTNDTNKKMRNLQDLLPNSQKDDNEALLDEAINYMTTLQHQVQMMTMGNRFVTPATMLPLGPQYSQMGLATGPVLMPIQNSALFTPTENYLPQSVPPAYAAFPNQIPNSTTSSNLDDARTHGGNLSGKESDKP